MINHQIRTISAVRSVAPGTTVVPVSVDGYPRKMLDEATVARPVAVWHQSLIDVQTISSDITTDTNRIDFQNQAWIEKPTDAVLDVGVNAARELAVHLSQRDQIQAPQKMGQLRIV